MVKVWAGIFASLIIIFIPKTGFAQQAEREISGATGLRVSPAILEVSLKPGQTVEKEIIVIHDANNPLPIQVIPRALNPVEDILEINKISTFNSAEWLEIDEPYHILSDKEVLKLKATITAPKDAEPGGHYAMISVEVLEPAKTRQLTGASISARLGILTFITVDGPLERELSTTGLNGPLMTANEIVRFSPEFKNTGTIHVMQNSKIHISNLFGSQTVEVPSRIILPNTKKEVQAVWRDVPLAGIYKIQLKGSYGPDGSPITSEARYLLVFRWLPLIGVFLPLGLLIWALYKTKGRWREAVRAFKSAGQSPPNSKRKKQASHKSKKNPPHAKKPKSTPRQKSSGKKPRPVKKRPKKDNK